MAYTSTTLTLAMTEFLAHVKAEDFDPQTPPELVYVTGKLPDEAVGATIETERSCRRIGTPFLSRRVNAALGDAWIRGAQSLGLLVLFGSIS